MKFNQSLVDYATLRAQVTPDKEKAHRVRALIAEYIGYVEDDDLMEQHPEFKYKVQRLVAALWTFARKGELPPIFGHSDRTR